LVYLVRSEGQQQIQIMKIIYLSLSKLNSQSSPEISTHKKQCK
jgi:hypothetical protein